MDAGFVRDAAMTEGQLITLIAGVLEAEGQRRGIPFLVVRDFQPSHQGRDILRPVVYIHPVTAVQRGWEAKSYADDPDDPALLLQGRREVWHTTFQFSGQAVQDGMAAIDVLTAARGAIISDAARASFKAAGTLPLGPSQIRQVWITNESAQQEPHPSFDMALGHYRDMVDPVAKVDEMTPDMASI